MLILTTNEYLKVAVETLTEQIPCHIKNRVVVFDAGESIYVLQDMLSSGGEPPNLCSLLTSGKRIGKKDIKTPEHFRQYFPECQTNRNSHDIGKRPTGLTACEEAIILALCNGYTPLAIAEIFNKSIKTVSCQKSTALRKLGMRNMQCLHRIFIRWNLALKSTSTFPCEQSPVWTNQMSVSSQCII
ncbi:helix-turn-helix transcriptional regulator [Serratia marcescens]